MKRIRNRARWRSIPLLLVLLISLPATLMAESVRQVWDEATLEYRAGRYASACEKFQQAARRAPENGALWADLALCLAKLGRRDAAVKANHRALRFGDSRIRSNATFNLAKLGVDIPMPKAGRCGALPPAPGCGKQLYACTFDWQVYGSGMGTYGSAVRIGRTEASAATYLGAADGAAGPTIPASITGVPVYDIVDAHILLEQREDMLCGKYDWWYDWSCEKSTSVRERVARCHCGSRDCLKSPDMAAVAPECFKRTCELATKSPWPAIRREKDRITRDLEKANEACRRNDDRVTGRCRIVAADACADGAGIVCNGDPGDPAQARVVEWIDLATYER